MVQCGQNCILLVCLVSCLPPSSCTSYVTVSVAYLLVTELQLV